MQAPDDLLSTTEAAEVIGTERSNVTRMVQAGRLTPTHKLPGSTGAFVFLRSEVERARDDYQARQTKAASA